MPITKTHRNPSTNVVESVERLFEGRVLKVVKVSESRNHSDTMDYSDFRTTECTYVLVWLGARGVPPRDAWRGMQPSVDAYVPEWKAKEVRDLEVHEQYGWVDCTNMWAWRGSDELVPEVDTFDMQLLHGGPEMIEGVALWEAHRKAVLEARAAEAEKQAAAASAAEDAEKAKRAARQAKKQAKEDALKAEAEKLLARIPAKGTTVTVDGFTGKVFWVGVAKYYGKFNARAGVKDSRGEIQWIAAEKF